MIIVTYQKITNKVISVCPIAIESDSEVDLIEEDGVTHKDYDYIIYNGTVPRFYEGSDGDLYLDTNRLVLEVGYLDGN